MSYTTAVILAAGLGTRFGDLTQAMPKGFIKVAGKSMIERSIEALIRCGIDTIYIGTGYKSDMYEALCNIYPQIKCCFSPRYAETNSMYTLFNMRNMIGKDDFLLLESDIIYEDVAITTINNDIHPNIMLITPVVKFQDQYYVEYDESYNLKNCSVNKTDLNPKGELVGIHKISNNFYNRICDDYETIKDESPKLGYEYQILSSSKQEPVYVLKMESLKWYEIDDVSDLEYAENKVLK